MNDKNKSNNNNNSKNNNNYHCYYHYLFMYYFQYSYKSGSPAIDDERQYLTSSLMSRVAMDSTAMTADFNHSNGFSLYV